MGFGTYALVHVYFNKATFNTRGAVESYIEDRKEEVERAKRHLKSLVTMTEPKKFCPEDCDPMAWLESEYEETMEELEVSLCLLDRAQAVLDGWKYMHHENGCALVNEDRKPMEENQRIDGDYIASCLPDGSNAYPDCEVGTRLYNEMVKKS